MDMSILKLKPGQVGILQKLRGDTNMSDRLIDVGIHPGVEVECIGQMPLSGPLVVRVGATLFALREEEAQCLIVKL